MNYAVIVRFKGNLGVHGIYKTRDAAQKRADRITGGEVHIMKTYSTDENQVLSEFRSEEVRAL